MKSKIAICVNSCQIKIFITHEMKLNSPRLIYDYLMLENSIK